MCEMAASIVPSAFRWSSASDFHRSAYAKRSSVLPVRFDLQQIGGSRAQRDIVDWTLTEPLSRRSAGVPCRLRMSVWGRIRTAPQTGAFSAKIA